jgi:hypothetical protein
MKTEIIKTAVKPTGPTGKLHPNIMALLAFFAACRACGFFWTHQVLKKSDGHLVPIMTFGDNWRN